MQKWRLLDTGKRTAAENMALDEVVLTARSRDLVPDTLRFLQFNPRCVLVGYHQTVAQEIREDYCRENGIDINRRITGGGGLFWDETQIGWEIIAVKDHPLIPKNIEELYAKLCSAVVLGLRKLGIKAEFRPRNDIEVNGRKISGTGGTELDGAFLFQGTLLVDFDVDTMLRALRIPTEKLKDKEIESVKERVTCIKWELGYVPSNKDIKQALVDGFKETLGIEFDPGGLVAAEEQLLAERLPEFQSEEWIHFISESPDSHQELRAVTKAKGGLIRASLSLDKEANLIKTVLLTGDFFAYPKRTIFDLEARLKNTPADPDVVTAKVEDFFARSGAQIPGVTPTDFSMVIIDALSKSRLTNYGIAPGDVNSIYTVCRPFEEINQFSFFLLPYCAKKTSCKYRYREGCALCGGCSIGDAFQLAQAYGLQPVTIQNYEMLEETLENLKAGGEVNFIGTCCEPFIAKHRDDFERINLPGILIDVDSTTCYDLGRVKEAKKGQFDNQTQLKLDLLRQVLEIKLGKRI